MSISTCCKLNIPWEAYFHAMTKPLFLCVCGLWPMGSITQRVDVWMEGEVSRVYAELMHNRELMMFVPLSILVSRQSSESASTHLSLNCQMMAA